MEGRRDKKGWGSRPPDKCPTPPSPSSAHPAKPPATTQPPHTPTRTHNKEEPKKALNHHPRPGKSTAF